MPTPTFTVVVPTRDRPAKLAQCLSFLARLGHAREDVEVIVVDDGSAADLAEIVRPFDEVLDLRLVRQRHSGPAVARNQGARLARGRYLAFTDDDCGPRPDWLRALAQAHAAAPLAAVGGTVRNAARSNAFAGANAALLAFVTEDFAAHRSSLAFYTSNNLSVPRARFIDLGGFNEANRLAAGEDRMFCHAWLARGWPLVHAPDAVVDHFHAQTAAGFLAMHYRYGRGARVFHTLNSVHAKDLRHGAGLGFYARMLRWPFAREPFPRATLTLGLMLLAQAAEAAGYLYEAGRPTRIA